MDHHPPARSLKVRVGGDGISEEMKEMTRSQEDD